MADPQISYEAIVRTEIAIGLMNRARGVLSERIAVFGGDQPQRSRR